MRDPLENFVRQNRSAFDDRDPSPALWARIAVAMGLRQPSQAGRRNRSLQLWRAAAIFFMVLSAGLLISRRMSTVKNAEAMREFSDVEAFYNQEINHKVGLIGEFQENTHLNGFTSDFQQLEAMYLVLKEEMKTRPSRQVRDALVLNLLVRIDLLNQHLERLEASQTEEPADNRST